jgi:four helix bundle protein
MSYQKLQIWQLARELTVEVHNMTLRLPKFEQFEEAQQIRRSVKSVRSNIVEGYGRRFYKNDYIKFIIYALASNDETIDHLDILFETKSLTDEKLYKDLRTKMEVLGRKINNFLQSVVKVHSRPVSGTGPESSSQNQES